jgi:hypothetical protein
MRLATFSFTCASEVGKSGMAKIPKRQRRMMIKMKMNFHLSWEFMRAG